MKEKIVENMISHVREGWGREKTEREGGSRQVRERMIERDKEGKGWKKRANRHLCVRERERADRWEGEKTAR